MGLFSRGETDTDPAIRTATQLGLFSYGLGITQLLRPGSVNRFVGVPDFGLNHTMQQIIGVREIVSGTGILFGNNTSGWMWSRVAGDIMDLTILAGTLGTPVGIRKKLVPAILALGALTVLDAKVAMESRGA